MSKYLIVCAILSCILDCKQSEVSRETIIRMDLKKMHQIDMHGEYARQICLTNDGTSVLIDEVKKVLLAGDQFDSLLFFYNFAQPSHNFNSFLYTSDCTHDRIIPGNTSHNFMQMHGIKCRSHRHCHS